MRFPRVHFSLCTIALGLLAVWSPAQAKDKKKKVESNAPQDVIEIVGHLSLQSGAVTGFIPTQHYSSYYLYAEHEGGKTVTLIDVTNANRPLVLADVPYPSGGGASASLVAVAGTAALVSDEAHAAPATPAAQTVRMMDFSDPQHPKVAHEFAGVTTMSRDDRRGLIFLANGDGVWILHQNFALDPEVEKAYAHHVLYDH